MLRPSPSAPASTLGGVFPNPLVVRGLILAGLEVGLGTLGRLARGGNRHVHVARPDSPALRLEVPRPARATSAQDQPRPDRVRPLVAAPLERSAGHPLVRPVDVVLADAPPLPRSLVRRCHAPLDTSPISAASVRPGARGYVGGRSDVPCNICDGRAIGNRQVGRRKVIGSASQGEGRRFAPDRALQSSLRLPPDTRAEGFVRRALRSWRNAIGYDAA
jgi:hypothetical protein